MPAAGMAPSLAEATPCARVVQPECCGCVFGVLQCLLYVQRGPSVIQTPFCQCKQLCLSCRYVRCVWPWQRSTDGITCGDACCPAWGPVAGGLSRCPDCGPYTCRLLCPKPSWEAPGRRMRQVPQQRLQLHAAPAVPADSGPSLVQRLAHLLLLCHRLLGGCWCRGS